MNKLPRDHTQRRNHAEPGIGLNGLSGGTVDDHERAVAAFRDSMRGSSGNDDDLSGAHLHDVSVELQVDLPFDDKQGFVERVLLVRVGIAVHANDLEVGASGFADDVRAPGLRQ